ncbi:site-specific integrase [uncultured Cohaesibacter sp.]|uniref:site-specific integrase n=1 Tax=uncultured Cohaesibacter sp. TaxID=1002546 RepID=UPI0029C89092|nr:site-specific integrase [uncultured Cohaesibacter sp.]
MSGHPRLYRRNATYYHRAAIPVDIKDTYPKTEETFSLNTKDYKEALKLVRVAAVDVDKKFDDHRQRQALRSAPFKDVLTDEQIKLVGEIHYHQCLDDNDWERAHQFGMRDGDAEELVDALFEDHVDGVAFGVQQLKQGNARGKLHPAIQGNVLELLETRMGIKLDPKSPSLRTAALEYQKASIRALQVIRERAKGEIVETPPAPKAKEVRASSVPKLSVAVDLWAAEKAKTSWVAKTEREHRVWMQHFIETVGDRPLDDYAKADARLFRTTLMKIPANWTKLPELKGIQKLSKAAEKADKLGLSPMSDNNINKLLGFVGSFWTWAEGIYDEVPSGLFKGLKLKINKKVRDERDPFAKEELRSIFHSPIYTGCQSVRHWQKPGPLVPRNAGIFWVPLISLFSGMRMGEVIQLYVKDVREEEGILYLDVNADGDDKHLKTLTSWRSVPVHPKLIEMGFKDLLENRKTEGALRLFPDLKIGDDGYYSSPFSKHFNRFLKSVGVKRQKNAFHSFRHNFEDACRDCDISKEIMDTLQGHGERGMSARYGKGHTLRKLSEAMERIEYRDLDLSHLIKASG